MEEAKVYLALALNYHCKYQSDDFYNHVENACFALAYFEEEIVDQYEDHKYCHDVKC